MSSVIIRASCAPAHYVIVQVRGERAGSTFTMNHGELREIYIENGATVVVREIPRLSTGETLPLTLGDSNA